MSANIPPATQSLPTKYPSVIINTFDDRCLHPPPYKNGTCDSQNIVSSPFCFSRTLSNTFRINELACFMPFFPNFNRSNRKSKYIEKRTRRNKTISLYILKLNIRYHRTSKIEGTTFTPRLPSPAGSETLERYSRG